MAVLEKPPSSTSQAARPQRSGLVGSAVRVVLGTLAVVLTVFAVWLGIDFLTHDYVEGEVLVVKVVLGAASMFALYAWAGAIVAFRAPSRTGGTRPLLVAGLVAAPVFAVGAVLLPPVVGVVAAVLAVGATAVALVEALRR